MLRGHEVNYNPGLGIAMCHDRYLMALDKNPVMTKAATSAVLTLARDLICQATFFSTANVMLLAFHAMRYVSVP
jgi:hypothetical protein